MRDRFHCAPILLALIALFAPATGTALGQEDEQTSDDPGVALEKLEIQLRPLTKEDLATQADGWLRVLQVKLREIRDAEIRALDAQGEDRARLATRIEELEGERDALIARLDTVLAALTLRGGDDAAYQGFLADFRPEKTESSLAAEDLDVEGAGRLLEHLMDWLKSPSGGIRWGLRILLFFAVLILFKIIASILGKLTRKATSRMKKASELLRDFFVNAVMKITFFIGIIFALSVLGVDIGPFLAAIGAIGFIVGFALQGTLGNFAAGIMILLYRPYDIGDVVTVSGVTGKVDAMSLVATTIKTSDNQIVVVPNGSIWGDVITNITGSDTRRVDMVVGIGYEDDVAKAQSVIERILADHPKILDDPEPVIRLHELADSSVNFVVRPWARTSDYQDVYWDVTRSVKERFDEEGISIPYPQQEVHVHQVSG